MKSEQRNVKRFSVGQGSPNYGPRAKSGPRSHFIRPAMLFHPAAKTHQ